MCETTVRLLKEKIIKTDAVIHLLVEKNYKMTQMQNKLKHLFERYAEKSKEAESLQEKACAYDSEHEPLKLCFKELEDRYLDLQGKHDQLLNTSELKFQVVNKELEAIAKENKKLTKFNAELRGKLAARKEIVKTVDEEEMDFLKTENEILSSRLDKLTERCESQMNKLYTVGIVSTCNSNSTEDISKRQFNVDDTQSKELSALREKVTKLDLAERKLRKEVTILRSEKRQLEDRLSEVQLEKNLLDDSLGAYVGLCRKKKVRTDSTQTLSEVESEVDSVDGLLRDVIDLPDVLTPLSDTVSWYSDAGSCCDIAQNEDDFESCSNMDHSERNEENRETLSGTEYRGNNVADIPKTSATPPTPITPTNDNFRRPVLPEYHTGSGRFTVSVFNQMADLDDGMPETDEMRTTRRRSKTKRKGIEEACGLINQLGESNIATQTDATFVSIECLSPKCKPYRTVLSSALPSSPDVLGFDVSGHSRTATSDDLQLGRKRRIRSGTMKFLRTRRTIKKLKETISRDVFKSVLKYLRNNNRTIAANAIAPRNSDRMKCKSNRYRRNRQLLRMKMQRLREKLYAPTDSDSDAERSALRRRKSRRKAKVSDGDGLELGKLEEPEADTTERNFIEIGRRGDDEPAVRADCARIIFDKSSSAQQETDKDPVGEKRVGDSGFSSEKSNSDRSDLVKAASQILETIKEGKELHGAFACEYDVELRLERKKEATKYDGVQTWTKVLSIPSSDAQVINEDIFDNRAVDCRTKKQEDDRSENSKGNRLEDAGRNGRAEKERNHFHRQILETNSANRRASIQANPSKPNSSESTCLKSESTAIRSENLIEDGKAEKERNHFHRQILETNSANRRASTQANPSKPKSSESESESTAIRGRITRTSYLNDAETLGEDDGGGCPTNDGELGRVLEAKEVENLQANLNVVKPSDFIAPNKNPASPLPIGTERILQNPNKIVILQNIVLKSPDETDDSTIHAETSDRLKMARNCSREKMQGGSSVTFDVSNKSVSNVHHVQARVVNKQMDERVLKVDTETEEAQEVETKPAGEVEERDRSSGDDSVHGHGRTDEPDDTAGEMRGEIFDHAKSVDDCSRERMQGGSSVTFDVSNKSVSNVHCVQARVVKKQMDERVLKVETETEEAQEAETKPAGEVEEHNRSSGDDSVHGHVCTDEADNTAGEMRGEIFDHVKSVDDCSREKMHGGSSVTFNLSNKSVSNVHHVQARVVKKQMDEQVLKVETETEEAQEAETKPPGEVEERNRSSSDDSNHGHGCTDEPDNSAGEMRGEIFDRAKSVDDRSEEISVAHDRDVSNVHCVRACAAEGNRVPSARQLHVVEERMPAAQNNQPERTEMQDVSVKSISNMHCAYSKISERQRGSAEDPTRETPADDPTKSKPTEEHKINIDRAPDANPVESCENNAAHAEEVRSPIAETADGDIGLRKVDEKQKSETLDGRKRVRSHGERHSNKYRRILSERCCSDDDDDSSNSTHECVDRIETLSAELVSRSNVEEVKISDSKQIWLRDLFGLGSDDDLSSSDDDRFKAKASSFKSKIGRCGAEMFGSDCDDCTEEASTSHSFTFQDCRNSEARGDELEVSDTVEEGAAESSETVVRGALSEVFVTVDDDREDRERDYRSRHSLRFQDCRNSETRGDGLEVSVTVEEGAAESSETVVRGALSEVLVTVDDDKEDRERDYRSRHSLRFRDCRNSETRGDELEASDTVEAAGGSSKTAVCGVAGKVLVTVDKETVVRGALSEVLVTVDDDKGEKVGGLAVSNSHQPEGGARRILRTHQTERSTQDTQRSSRITRSASRSNTNGASRLTEATPVLPELNYDLTKCTDPRPPSKRRIAHTKGKPNRDETDRGIDSITQENGRVKRRATTAGGSGRDDEVRGRCNQLERLDHGGSKSFLSGTTGSNLGSTTTTGPRNFSFDRADARNVRQSETERKSDSLRNREDSLVNIGRKMSSRNRSEAVRPKSDRHGPTTFGSSSTRTARTLSDDTESPQSPEHVVEYEANLPSTPRVIPLESAGSSRDVSSRSDLRERNVASMELREPIEAPTVGQSFCRGAPNDESAARKFKKPNCRKRVGQVCKSLKTQTSVTVEKPQEMPPDTARQLFMRLLNFGTEPTVVDEVAGKFAGQEEEYVASLVLSEVRLYPSEEPDTKHTPPAPVLTQTQRLLLGFMCKLDDSGVPGLLESFMRKAERRLLTEVDPSLMQPVARLFLGVCKLKKNLDRMRRMVCDAAYFMGDLAVPFLFLVLSTWIEVLPLQINAADEALVKVLIQVVNMKTCSQPGYNLIPLRKLLNLYYGYPTERWNSDEVFLEIFKKFTDSPNKTNEYSMLILCKNHPPKWILRQIEMHVAPTLRDSKDSRLKTRILTLTGHLCARLKEDAEHVQKIQGWLKPFLGENSAPTKIREEVRRSPRTTTTKR